MTTSILLLEEHIDCRSATSVMLRAYGFDCRVFESVNELIDAAATQSKAVILADYFFAGIEGEELLRRLGEVAPDSPVILMSSHADETLKPKSMASGATHFLQKPYAPEALIDTISTLIE